MTWPTVYVGPCLKGERLVCELAYAPSAAETLDNYKVTCGIINGRKYTINLSAQGHRPALKFSFHSFDFGRNRRILLILLATSSNLPHPSASDRIPPPPLVPPPASSAPPSCFVLLPCPHSSSSSFLTLSPRVWS